MYYIQNQQKRTKRPKKKMKRLCSHKYEQISLFLGILAQHFEGYKV